MIFMVIIISSSRHILFISQSPLRRPPPSVLDNKSKLNFHTLFAFELYYNAINTCNARITCPPLLAICIAYINIHSIVHTLLVHQPLLLHYGKFVCHMQKYQKVVHLIFNRSQQVRTNPILIHFDLLRYHYHLLLSILCIRSHPYLSQNILTISKRENMSEKIALFANFHLYTHSACILSHTGIIIIFH